MEIIIAAAQAHLSDIHDAINNESDDFTLSVLMNDYDELSAALSEYFNPEPTA